VANNQLGIINQQLKTIYSLGETNTLLFVNGVIGINLGADINPQGLIAYMDITVLDANDPKGIKFINFDASEDILNLLIIYKQFLLFGWSDDLIELRNSLVNEFSVPETVLDLIEFNAFKHLMPKHSLMVD
jgi:hypothetical protein